MQAAGQIGGELGPGRFQFVMVPAAARLLLLRHAGEVASVAGLLRRPARQAQGSPEDRSTWGRTALPPMLVHTAQ